MRDLLDQLPAQPDGRRRAAVVPGRAGGTSTHPRLLPRVRRGVQRALVRRPARVGGAAPGPAERRALPDPVEALVDDGVPLRLRMRRAGADRRAAVVPTERRDCAAGVRPARIYRGVERRDARRADARVLRTETRAARPAARARAGLQPGDALSL